MMSNNPSAPILSPGRNCWRIERADRLALIVDAADYFHAVKAAILEARHCVYLIGWDFDTRIKFEPEHQTLDGPNKLGPFLHWIDSNRPDVEVYVLKWPVICVSFAYLPRNSGLRLPWKASIPSW
jgi:phospholipase D1/2